MLKFDTIFLFDKDLDGTNDIRDVKIIIFVTLKFSSLNKTQIEKFDHFSANSIAVDASNKKQYVFKIFFELLIEVIDLTDFNLKIHSIIYYKGSQLSKY